MRSVAMGAGVNKGADAVVGREEIEAEIAMMVREALDELLRRSAAEEFDFDAIEVTTQELLRRIGGRMVERAVVQRVHSLEANPPDCPECGRRMERELRHRDLVGLVGEYRVNRGYYRCRHCHTHCIPADTALGIGPGALSPALGRIAAMAAAQVSFGSSSASINDTLSTKLTEAEVYRTAEALGAVAEAEIIAATSEETATPVQPASDTLLIGADGTTTFTDGDWHEVKVGVVAPLGPQRQVDPETGRARLTIGEKTYCALVGSADTFFPRLRVLANESGWGHPALCTVVAIGDGSPWIWNRMASFTHPGVKRVEILDYIHASQHVWDVSKAVFGAESLDAYIWGERYSDLLKEQGPDPLLKALDLLQPETAEGCAAVTNAREYSKLHTAAGRMDYPGFIAGGLPIASGIVEAGCNSVVCQRTKGAGKRWRRLGAQAVLNLRCFRLSPSRWTAFFHRHPGPRRSPVATLRKEAA